MLTAADDDTQAGRDARDYPPLSLRDVRAGYGRIEVLHGIDLDVRRGAVTALLGPNGAGKTTALGVMSGLLTPTAGCRHVEGRHLNRAGAEDLARIGICHIREGRSVFPNLSVADNLVVAASSGAPVERIEDVAFTLFPRLKERRTQLAGTLSGGEKQMLALARGLGTDPAVLLVDELSMGLAPLVVDHLYDSVAQIAAAGVSVLVVEQFATIGLRVAEHVYVMAHGVIAYAGPAEGAMDAVHDAYLGERRVTELLQFTLFGLMLGCVYAIAAMGLVLTYTVTGVFNFAHGAVGMLVAFCFYQATVEAGLPAPIGFVLVVFVLAPLMGLLAERLLRGFSGTDYATLLVVTIALTVGLLGFAQKVFPPGEQRNLPYLFGDNRIVIASVPISYDRIFQVIVAIAVAFGLRFLLFGTPTGARMRAVVDDPELARLNGVQSTRIARLSWMVGFSLAGLGGVLFAAGQNLNAIVLTLLVLSAYGAAMVGRLTSLPLTFLGALALGLCQELTNVSWLYPDTDFWLRFRLAIPGVFLVVAVVFVPSIRLSAGRLVGRDEPAVPTLRGSLRNAALLVAGIALLVQVGSPDIQSYAVRGLVIATIALSLVAVTGLSGQVSLTQYLFVGVGAFIAGDVFGGDSVFGMLLGGLAAAVLGVIVALPSARLRGLHLALSTFGMALIGRELVLGSPRVFGLGGLAVGRPEIFGISTESDAAFAVWCAVVFSVLAVLVGAVRRSWFGRQLTAVRDSELASATLGLPVRTTKVVVFALAGFIAGCSGSLYGGLSGAVQGTQFDPVNSLVILLFAFVGGITSVAGALLAGALYALLTYAEATFPDLAGIVFVAVAAAALGLGRQPNGLAGVLLDARDRLRGVRLDTAHAVTVTIDRHRTGPRLRRARMTSRPPAPRSVRVARVALAVVAASALLGGGPAWASSDREPVSAAALGGFTGSAASSPTHVTYMPEGLLPTGAPLDLGAPDALATIASGPATFARASAADPGDLIANPDALLALASSSYKAGTIPAYPYRVAVSSGVGEPTAESHPAPGLDARVTAKDTGSKAESTMPGLAAPGVATAGSLAALAETSTDGTTVTVHSRTKVSDIDILGVVHIDSIVTDLVGTSTGGPPKLSGGTTVSGAKLLGTPITIDDKGVRATGGGLDVGQVLKSLGITITLPGRVAMPGHESGELASTGLRIEIAATSTVVPGVGGVLDALPPIEPVAPGAPGVEDILVAARARHLTTVELGRGVVALSASPEVVFPDLPVDITPVAPGISSTDTGIVSPDTGTLADPVVTPAPAGGATLTPATPTEPISVSVGTGIGALVALALLLQPFLGHGLARVAAVQLGTDEEGCPWERR